MPPESGTPVPEKSSKNPKSTRPDKHNRTIITPNNYCNSNFNFHNITKRYSYVSIHPRSCLIIFIIVLQISLLTLSYYHPFFLSRRRLNHHISTFSAAADPISADPISAFSASNSRKINFDNSTTTHFYSRPHKSDCELGKFYVYDLPAEFNVDIHKNCDKLSPFGSRCSAFSNNGFGLPAVEINNVIPSSLANTWYWTDQFSSEILFHNRTLTAESAAAYYIPFYAGLEVGKFLWGDKSVKERDAHCEMMLHYIGRLFPYFNQSNGWDHFLVMGRITWDFRRTKDEDWGSKCIHMSSMRNITRLLIERNPWDYLDVGVPYPTGFHPNTDSDVALWQSFVSKRERNSLFCFVGGTRGFFRNDFRGLLLNQCRDSGGSCRVVDCSGTRCANDTAGTTEILETFLDSEFCLQPRGDSFTRRSIFECMIAGSIPVFFWRRSAYLQYKWFLPGEPDSYSVFIHRDEVKNGTSIKSVLEKYSKDEVNKMREKVVEFIPKFIYGKPNKGLGTIKDAVDIAVDGVLRRIKKQKVNGFYW
ncbi:hypothetical protein KSS87_022489 [Heliosperma pusillum]|nr:hypothetical protein KSS87_022489 [Heliosperma pusillum]